MEVNMAVSNERPTNAPLVAFVAVAVLFGVFWGVLKWGEQYFSSLRVAPEEIVQGPLPDGVRVLSALKPDGGLIGEFLLSEELGSVSIVVAKRDTPVATSQISGADFVQAVRVFEAERKDDSRVAPLLIRYGASHFEAWRGGDFSEGTLAVGKNILPSVKFQSRKDRFYEVAVLNRRPENEVGKAVEEQVLIAALRRAKPVDSAAVSRFLAQLGRFNQ